MRVRITEVLVLITLASFGLATGAGGATAGTSTPSPTPEVTADLVLVMEDSYGAGELATIAVRNDGEVAYRVPKQPLCSLVFKDATTARTVIVAGHCDLPGYSSALIEPGESVAFLSDWNLSECTEPGFSCTAVCPLPTGQYTVSGALPSADDQQSAEFSKTFSITGPQFTSDISLDILYVISDPPSAAGIPAYLQLRNKGQVDYKYPVTAACHLAFKDPAGFRFSIPAAAHCQAAEDTLSPGEVATVVSNWQRDQCTEFGQNSCLVSQSLAPGVYVISGALWSADRQSYAEFSTTLTILATPSPTLGGFPRGGGAPVAGDALPLGAAAAPAFGAVFAGLGGFALARGARPGRRS